jgi:hypothetical protein
MERRCYINYDLHTMPDGGIVGWCSTNDNDDDGVAGDDESWEVGPFNDRAMMDRVVGKSRIGISGIKVTVTLDGEEIK